MVKLDSNGCMGNYCGLTDPNCYYLPYPDCITSVNEYDDEDLKVSVYPNPATNEFTILSEKHKIQNVILYDIAGKAQDVVIKESKETVMVLHIDKLTTGIYFCHIILANGQMLVKKVVKQ